MKRDLRDLIVELGHRTSTLKEVEVDFEKLSDRLMKKYNINLAERSLKKLFSNLKVRSQEKPKQKTLDRLSILAGFQSWKDLQHAFMGN